MSKQVSAGDRREVSLAGVGGKLKVGEEGEAWLLTMVAGAVAASVGVAAGVLVG